jgi:hypothetical protein
MGHIFVNHNADGEASLKISFTCAKANNDLEVSEITTQELKAIVTTIMDIYAQRGYEE